MEGVLKCQETNFKEKVAKKKKTQKNRLKENLDADHKKPCATLRILDLTLKMIGSLQRIFNRKAIGLGFLPQ